MGTKKKSVEEEIGFEPVTDESIGFTPLEEGEAGANMASAMFPTMESEEEIPLDQNILETTSDVVTTLPQGVTTWADEIQASLQAGGKKLLGNEKPLMDIYNEDVSGIRQGVSAARERSPWATTAGEFGAGIGTALLPGALAAKGIGGLGAIANTAAAGKLGGLGGMAARGFVEGAGTAETMDPYEVGIFGGLGAVGGGIGGLASKGVKAITTQSPARIRAGVLGARTAEFKEVGQKERENLAEELNKMGLFQKTKAFFDSAKGKWIPQGSALENIEKPTREKILARVDDAFRSTQAEKDVLFSQEMSKPVGNQIRVMSKLDDAVNNYSKKRSGMKGRRDVAQKELQNILDDIQEEIDASPNKTWTVQMLENAKQRLDRDVGQYGKDPLMGKSNDLDDLYKDFYGAINDSLKFEIPNKDYGRLNALQQKLYTTKIDLKKAIAGEAPTFKPTDVNTWFNSPESQLDVARAAEVMNMPGLKQIKRPLRMGTSELPFGAIRYLDPSMPDQSQKPMPLINFSPREIIDFRIPRSTNGILEQKDKVLAKFVQKGLPDEMAETLTMALNGDPDDLSNIMPLIMTQFPDAFEKSKYKVFDGKFLDPNDKARAADSISKREDINSIQRAKMISKINKTGEVPEGMA
jgi:hypothetical protein